MGMTKENLWALQGEWYKRLGENFKVLRRIETYEDIEQIKSNSRIVNDLSNGKFVEPKRITKSLDLYDYYLWCMEVLEGYDFDLSSHKFIWHCYAEGCSADEIVFWLKRSKFKKFKPKSRSGVQRRIEKILEDCRQDASKFRKANDEGEHVDIQAGEILTKVKKGYLKAGCDTTDVDSHRELVINELHKGTEPKAVLEIVFKKLKKS